MEECDENCETVDQETNINNSYKAVNADDGESLANGSNFYEDLSSITENNKTVNKMKRQRNDIDEEAKRIADEAYNREVHEQRYKRLMHLLDKSQFYSSYIINKIDGTNNKSSVKGKAKERRKGGNNENVPPSNKIKETKTKLKTGSKYDIRDYIPKNVQKKMSGPKTKLNLSEEEIEDELNVVSDTEAQEIPETKSHKSFYFNGTLREYQIEGLQWLKILYENGLNGILADEMGLGKTVQVIALFCHLIEKKQDGPYLIIAPLSTMPNWITEFERFAPKLPVVLYHQQAGEKHILQQRVLKKYPVSDTYRTQPIVLTTYEMPIKDRHFLKTQTWRYIVIDEGQRIKNQECQLLRVLQTCRSMNRLLLTGTPLQNNLAELWSLLHFLLPEIFDDLAIFESWFNVKEMQNGEQTEKILKQEEEKRILSTLREILKPFMLRREKADVCLDIPAKKEVLVYTPISQMQYNLYKAVLNRDIQTLSKLQDEPPIIPLIDGKRPKRKCVGKQSMSQLHKKAESVSSSELNVSESSRDSDYKSYFNDEQQTLSMWQQYTDVTKRNLDFLLNTQLHRPALYKRIINHPYLVHWPLNPDGTPQIDEDFITVSGKLLTLDAMLPKLKAKGHKVLLFSTMVMLLDVIEDYFSLRNYQFVRLDGRVKIDDRKVAIDEFNTNPDIFVFLISTRAGGVGLNLAAADTVIIYDSDWNPQADIQAMARCHRIGQTRPVVIYRFCTKGTIDEAIIKRAEGKRLLEKLVISKQASSLNLNNKEVLIQLKEFLDSKECEVVKSDNKVFTEAELIKLLDRSDM